MKLSKDLGLKIMEGLVVALICAAAIAYTDIQTLKTEVVNLYRSGEVVKDRFDRIENKLDTILEKLIK